MPTAAAGPWLEEAIRRGLIRPEQLLPTASRTAVVPTAMPTAMPDGMSERDFQRRVVELAVRHGWRVFHVHNSRRSEPGWPDLAICRPGALILAELKTDTGKLRPEQTEWLELLRTVPGLTVRLWRPSDWAAVVTELTEGGV